MSISGPLGPRSLSAYGLTPAARPPVARPSAPVAPAVQAPAADVAMPHGSDPNLWKVLTTEEKAFFLRQSQLGPATYGRTAAPSSTARAPLGARLDVTG
jgi:hypothetical protein